MLYKNDAEQILKSNNLEENLASIVDLFLHHST